jgi:rubrerythrin
MSNLKSKTKKNLEDAFAGESMARNKYTYFASVARKAGFIQMANIFEETANNEKEHAKLWAKELELIATEMDKNLAAAVTGEHFENSDMYPRMAAEAEEEGYPEIARKFKMVAGIEKEHEARYKKLLASLKEDKVFKCDEVVRWKCNNCGHIHEGKNAPEKCPVCDHPKDYFEVQCLNY